MRPSGRSLTRPQAQRDHQMCSRSSQLLFSGPQAVRTEECSTIPQVRSGMGRSERRNAMGMMRESWSLLCLYAAVNRCR